MALTPQAGRMRLVAKKLDGARGGQLLFAGLDFTLSPGGALLVKGPNGAGKSTLLRIAAGLLPPAGGSIALEGSTLGAQSHYLSTGNAMKPTLSVGENLRFWKSFLRESREEFVPTGTSDMEAVEALDAVGLAHTLDLPFGVLSTGQRRRAALARLLVASRPLWLLDEPASGLDAASQARFGAILRGHLRSGGMVMAAVHDDPDLPGAAEIRLGGSVTEAAS